MFASWVVEGAFLVTTRLESFFLFSPAGNVLLTEDGTVKLGKIWDVMHQSGTCTCKCINKVLYLLVPIPPG